MGVGGMREMGGWRRDEDGGRREEGAGRREDGGGTRKKGGAGGRWEERSGTKSVVCDGRRLDLLFSWHEMLFTQKKTGHA